MGFAGFKAGMTHVTVLDTRKNSPTKGHEVSYPVTVIECPPLKVLGVRLYGPQGYGAGATKDIITKADKRLSNRVGTKETAYPETISATKATLLVHTQPALTGIGQKTPNVFELSVGGKPEDVLAFAKAHKEIKVSDALKAGQFVDVHGITKGQGFVGVVKKAGVGIRRHKSEKVKRGAVMGPEGYAKVTFEANMPGRMGNHTRTEWNKKVFAITHFSAEQDITPKGGFVGYGQVKNDYMLIKGSIVGTKKGLLRFVIATRKDPKATEDAPVIEHIHKESQQ
jgi:large subunit ribosomal protein L3